MPTDEERREVAQRLRRLAGRHDGVVWVVIEKHLGLVSDDHFLGSSVYTSDSVLHVADLIDPEPERTCHMVRDNLTDTTYCDVCGERFDQPWYLGAKPHGVDILDYHVEYRDARYCPHCGARVVDE